MFWLNTSFPSKHLFCNLAKADIQMVTSAVWELTDKLLLLWNLFLTQALDILVVYFEFYRWRFWWNGWTPLSTPTGFNIIYYPACKITSDVDSTKTDVALALSAVSFDQIYGAKPTTRRTWTLSTICSTDTFYPNKSSLTSNSLTSNNHDLHWFS